MKNRPGSAALLAVSRARNPPERGASQYMPAAAMLSASRNHRNHSGPPGQNGSAVHCDQNAGQLGSTAVTRETGQYARGISTDTATKDGTPIRQKRSFRTVLSPLRSRHGHTNTR